MMPAQSRRRRRLAPAAVAAGAVLLGACNGDNLFRLAVSASAPEITAMTVPESAAAGATFTVHVEATGSRPIVALNIVLSSAVQKNIPVAIDPAATGLTQDVLVGLPGAVADSILVVTATVTDTTGAVSEAVTRQVRITAAVAAASAAAARRPGASPRPFAPALVLGPPAALASVPPPPARPPGVARPGAGALYRRG